MMTIAAVAVLMATLPSPQAPSTAAPAQQVQVEVMTCAQLKAEGERQLAIMQNARYNDLDADLSDEVAMIKLGERQGRRSVALGGIQAIAGMTGNSAAVAQAGRANDAMARSDKVERDAILGRAQARNQASEKAENRAGEHFIALTEQYRRRGCKP